MLTEQQQSSIIKLALTAFKNQFGIDRTQEAFTLVVGKPDKQSLCSLYITSNRADDNFKIKLYVLDFGLYNNVEQFRLIQEQNYSSGANDEIQLANCRLDKQEFKSFYKYLLSSQFLSDVINDTDRIKLEDDTGFILSETNSNIIFEH